MILALLKIWVLITLLFKTSAGLRLKFEPSEGAFFVKFESRKFQNKFQNSHQKPTAGLHPFLVHGCPKPKQILQAQHAGHSSSVPLRSLISTNSNWHQNKDNLHLYPNSTGNLNCGVTVKLLNAVVTKDFPAVTFFIYVDTEIWKATYTTPHDTNMHNTPVIVVYARLEHQITTENCKLFSLTNSVFTCTIRLIIPYSWWPSETTSKHINKDKKQPKIFLNVGYVVHNSFAASLANYQKHLNPFDTGRVELSATANFYMAAIDKVLTVLVPNSQFFPGLIFSVPILFHYDPIVMEGTPVHLFKLRCRAKEGLKILKVEELPKSGWSIQPELNFKNTTVTVSAFYRGYFALNETWSAQVLTLVVEVVDYPKFSTGRDKHTKQPRAELTWSVRYVFAGVSAWQTTVITGTKTTSRPRTTTTVRENHANTTENSTVQTNPGLGGSQQVEEQQADAPEKPSNIGPSRALIETLNSQRKVITHLRVEKDSVFALVPIALNFDLINTAVLTGKQVSETLKIYSVTYSGQATDVTLQSSCIADQPSILKVTPSCTAVYLDGSETRGELNSSILVEFAGRRTTASFTVWYPVTPMHVSLSDPVLHAVKGWRLPVPKKPISEDSILASKRKRRQHPKRNKRRLSNKSRAENFNCKLRYQEAEIHIFTKFRVEDLKTGHRSYLGGQGQALLLDVTDIADQHLKVSDESVAKIYRSTKDGKIMVYGVAAGQTDVKVISPLAGYVFGSAKLEVTNEKVGLRQLRAVAIAGLNLTIDLVNNSAHQSGLVNYQAVAKVSTSQIFVRKYQPGTLSLSVQYLDGMTSGLSDIDPRSFRLDAWSRDTDQVVFISKTHKSYAGKGLGPVPNFLTINDRTGGIPVEIELRTPEICQSNDRAALLQTTAFVEMSFHQYRTFFILKNQETRFASPLATPAVGLQDVLMQETAWRPADGTNRREDTDDDSQASLKLNIQSKKSKESQGIQRTSKSSGYSPLEVILLVLLAVVALAGSVATLNCLIYGPKNNGYKFQRLVPGFIRLPHSSSESATPCQEWVWLSRDQLEGSSVGRPQRKYSATENNSASNLLSGCYCALGRNLHSPKEEQEEEEEEETTEFVNFSDNHFGTVQSTSLGSKSSAGSSKAVPTHKRVSYQGSEVSIHISPQPCMEIHPQGYHTGPPRHWQSRRAASWNHSRSLGSRMRITSNPIIDSSSEQNLSTIAPLSPLAGSETLTAKSEGEVAWDSRSLGLNEIELRDYFSSLRETVA